ncbi:MAG: hypothetical protein BWX68_02735 [Verrucomicrobia bacterium ADurb.Bin063]|jgi:hypothetical protein|nr:MAG: hypothetical protein BWX68_02735 [Verrucomicrobia bacterium ADurb.Bin063]
MGDILITTRHFSVWVVTISNTLRILALLLTYCQGLAASKMTFTRVAAQSALEAAREWSYARLDPLKLSVSSNSLCGVATMPARR